MWRGYYTVSSILIYVYIFHNKKVGGKTTVKYHYTPIKMAIIQNTDDTKC